MFVSSFGWWLSSRLVWGPRGSSRGCRGSRRGWGWTVLVIFMRGVSTGVQG